jgi:hypothetical protein
VTDGESTFQDLVRKKCHVYYDIYDIMIDRASTRAKASSYDLDDKEDAEEDYHRTEDDYIYIGNIRSEVSTINNGATTSVGGVSDIVKLMKMDEEHLQLPKLKGQKTS